MKRAIPKEGPNPVTKAPNKKVFLGGLPLDATKEDITQVVGEYGVLFDVQIMTEKGTEKPRGFGFAIFREYDGAEALVRARRIKINVSVCACVPACQSDVSKYVTPSGCVENSSVMWVCPLKRRLAFEDES